MSVTQKTIAPYYGGKASHAKYILPVLATIPHRCYVEPFGGLAGILLQKPPAKVEVYNDMDGALVTLFRVMRDHPAALQDAIASTPYGRAEYHDCLARLRSGRYQDVELARITYCLLCMSFNGSLKHAGYSHQGPCYTGNNAQNMHSTAHFHCIAARLAGVQIENTSYERILRNWTHPNTLFYLDPPYDPETRNSTAYRHEWSTDDHHTLTANLIAGGTYQMYVLSGYNTPAYDPLMAAGWIMYDWNAPVMHVGNGKRKIKVECLWISPAAQTATHNLFSEQNKNPSLILC